MKSANGETIRAAGGEVGTARWMLRVVGAQGEVDVDGPGGQRLGRAVVGARNSWLPGKRLDRPEANTAFSIGRAIFITHVMSEHQRGPHVSGFGQRRLSETAPVRVYCFYPVRYDSPSKYRRMVSDMGRAEKEREPEYSRHAKLPLSACLF